MKSKSIQSAILPKMSTTNAQNFTWSDTGAKHQPDYTWYGLTLHRYSCNRFDEKDSQQARDNQAVSVSVNPLLVQFSNYSKFSLLALVRDNLCENEMAAAKLEC